MLTDDDRKRLDEVRNDIGRGDYADWLPSYRDDVLWFLLRKVRELDEETSRLEHELKVEQVLSREYQGKWEAGYLDGWEDGTSKGHVSASDDPPQVNIEGGSNDQH